MKKLSEYQVRLRRHQRAVSRLLEPPLTRKYIRAEYDRCFPRAKGEDMTCKCGHDVVAHHYSKYECAVPKCKCKRLKTRASLDIANIAEIGMASEIRLYEVGQHRNRGEQTDHSTPAKSRITIEHEEG